MGLVVGFARPDDITYFNSFSDADLQRYESLGQADDIAGLTVMHTPGLIDRGSMFHPNRSFTVADNRRCGSTTQSVERGYQRAVDLRSSR